MSLRDIEGLLFGSSLFMPCIPFSVFFQEIFHVGVYAGTNGKQEYEEVLLSFFLATGE